MRELELTISESLKNGLRPEKVPTGIPAMEECFGFRCGKLWLEGYKQLYSPLNPAFAIATVWPFPQMLCGDTYNILVIRDPVQHWDAVYEVSKDHSVITPIIMIDALTFGEGTLMEFADFGKYAFMTNGVMMVRRDVSFNLWEAFTADTKIPLMRTICNFKGQAIGGNIVSSWHECDETYIIWSKIGEMDFTPDDKNTAGFRRDPFGGVVHNIRRLHDMAIIYSSKGITAMLPTIDPAPTFGFKELYDVGIINQGAINGNWFQHLFVNTNYELCQLTNEGVKVLGYRDYVYRLAGEDIIVSYDQTNKDFYISNSSMAFLYSPYGLTEAPQFPSALWYGESRQWILPPTMSSTPPWIQTEEFDFGYRGQKTIFVLEVGCKNYTAAMAAIDWVIDNGDWRLTHWQVVNNQGVATLIIAGTDFNVRLKFSGVTTDTVINYIKVRYKMTDVRSIRGVYAPPPRGQVG